MLSIKKNIILRYFIVSLFILFFQGAFAQGWERPYGGLANETGYDIVACPDGGFVSAGFHQEINGANKDILVLRVDADGDTLWTRSIGEEGSDDEAMALVALPDGSWAVCGYTRSYNAVGKDAFLAFLDASGRVKGQYQYGDSDYDQFNDLVYDEASDRIILSGYTLTPTAGYAAYLVAVDLSGNQLWSGSYGGEGHEIGNAIVKSPDGNFVSAGLVFSGTSEQDIYILKTDIAGNALWEQYISMPGKEQAKDLIVTPDGEIILLGSKQTTDSNADFFLVKTNANGIVVWTKTFGGDANDFGEAIAFSPQGGFLLSGSLGSNPSGNENIGLIEVDADGNEQWWQIYGGEQSDCAFGIAADQAGYALAGLTSSFGNGNKDFYIVRTDIQGALLNNHIKGKVFFDANGNCAFDEGEAPQKGWMIQAVGSQVYYGRTDEDGNFDLVLPPGDYAVSSIAPDKYWTSCTTSYIVSLYESFGSVQLYMGTSAAISCADIFTDVSSPWLSPCQQVTYSISYENKGTATADNSFLKIFLDDDLTFLSATLPAQQIINTLTIPVGDLAPGQKGSLDITAHLSCNALVGETHPVTVKAFPNTICMPPAPDWNGAAIVTSITSLDDSIHFEIKNTGTATTEPPVDYIVIEDELIYLSGAAPLNPGQSLSIAAPANGSTWRLQATQVAGFPGKSAPCAAIEGYTWQTGQALSLGHIDQFPADDANSFVATDYQENASAFGMQDLRGYPTGYSEPHYIEPSTDIDYLIRFHNTSGDTIRFMEIVDSIPANLDINTIVPGASSYPYRVMVSENGVIKFIFDNVEIPDISVNLDAGHGFIRFRISQLPDLPTGTVILNRAMISYEGQAFVHTNTTIHTIRPLGVMINGLIQTEDDLPVGNVTVNAGIPPAQLVQWTDENGAYSFPVLAADGNYKIVPSRNDFYLNGVTTYDLLLISKHILGIMPLGSPYKMIAADVNRSGTITALDMLEIRKLILGVTDTFYGNTSWRFVPATYEFPDQGNPFSMEIPTDYDANNLVDNLQIDFTGIKTGDVNNSAAPQLTDHPESRSMNDLNTVLRVVAEPLDGGRLRYAFYADGKTWPTSAQLEGLQFTVYYDKGQLDWSGIETATANFTMNNLGLKHVDEGIITVSWETVTAITPDKRSPLFYFYFNQLHVGQTVDPLRLGSAVTKAEAYILASGVSRVSDLELVQEGVWQDDRADLEVYPNPTEGVVTISWTMEKAGYADLLLDNVFGTALSTICDHVWLMPGYYQVQLKQEDIPLGISLVELQALDSRQTIKLVRLH